VKQAVEVLILCVYCNCIRISLRDLSSSALLVVLVTYLHTSLYRDVVFKITEEV